MTLRLRCAAHTLTQTPHYVAAHDLASEVRCLRPDPSLDC